MKRLATNPATKISQPEARTAGVIRLFRVFIPTSVLWLLILDTLFVFTCYLAAVSWQMDEAMFYLQLDNGYLRVGLVTLSVIIGFYLSDFYEHVRLKSYLLFVQQLCLIIGVAFLLQALLSYARLSIQMPRQSMLLGSSLCLILLPAWRIGYGRFMLRVFGAERLVFAGTHPLQMRISDYLDAHPEIGMRPVGFYVETEEARTAVRNYRVLGTVADLAHPSGRLAEKPAFDQLIIGLADDAPPNAAKNVLEFNRFGYQTANAAATYERVFGRVAILQLRPTDIVLTGSFEPSPLHSTLQTIYSRLFALAGLIVLSPLMVLAALAVRLTSPGPALFRQNRTGKNDIPFVMFKFRSMYDDAEARTGAVWAQENDPRVTWVGRIIRKYRIDELPQLINVLRGDMSLVGPRPERPEFVHVLEEKIPCYTLRHNVKPGITGWAQIKYHYGNTLEDTVMKLEYDLFYIKHLSPQLDLYIMFHTIKTMLLTRGAY